MFTGIFAPTTASKAGINVLWRWQWPSLLCQLVLLSPQLVIRVPVEIHPHIAVRLHSL